MCGRLKRRRFFRVRGEINAAPDTSPRLLREIMEDALEAAAQAGFPDPERLWHMSPAAIERAFIAHSVQAVRDDRRAWMAGYYCAFAFHEPRRFPRKPTLIRQISHSMTEKEMQRRLLIFAAERNDYNDVGNTEN